MRVIGTAGHVDHGKSTLIEALTGIHPDRLQEERDREMTIVLGFAWLTLDNGEEVGIIDVPGHRDFIANMLSGIGAIDAALFVVAADEGVMPQTLEHLAILDLLQIQGGVVALTKADVIEDPEWLDLVEVDLAETLSGTVLESAPIVRVSAKTGEGIPALLAAISVVLEGRPQRLDLGRPRLPVDRVFSMPGFGTVVTGTLKDGNLGVGDEVVILPAGFTGRIRGLQTHKRKEQIAVPGSRTAINISGVDVDQVQRGDVIAHRNDYRPTRRIDVHFRLLPDTNLPIQHNTEVKLFIGASEVLARLRLLGQELLKPGEEGWLQLELRHPVVAIRGDRYIIRRPSPGETIGGGVVVDPAPARRHKRFNQAVLEKLEQLAGGTPADILLQSILTAGIVAVRDGIAHSSLEAEAADVALRELLDSHQAIVLEGDPELIQPDTIITANVYWLKLQDRIRGEILNYHKVFPLRQGIPREELKSRVKLSTRLFNLVFKKIRAEGLIAQRAMRQNLPGINPVPVIYESKHEIRFSQDQQEMVGRLMKNFEADPFAPPTIKSCIADVGEDLYQALIDLGQLMPVSGEVVFRWKDYESMVEQVRKMITTGGSISVAQMRDRFQTSRRYVLAFLEHLDAIGVTARDGDVRKLRK